MKEFLVLIFIITILYIAKAFTTTKNKKKTHFVQKKIDVPEMTLGNEALKAIQGSKSFLFLLLKKLSVCNIFQDVAFNYQLALS